MSETYDFPDAGDIPQIKTATDEPFTRPEQKRLFIQYDADEWESEADVENVLETINYLFGPEVQVAILPDDYDLLDESEVRNMLSEVGDGDS